MNYGAIAIFIMVAALVGFLGGFIIGWFSGIKIDEEQKELIHKQRFRSR